MANEDNKKTTKGVLFLLLGIGNFVILFLEPEFYYNLPAVIFILISLTLFYISWEMMQNSTKARK